MRSSSVAQSSHFRYACLLGYLRRDPDWSTGKFGGEAEPTFKSFFVSNLSGSSHMSFTCSILSSEFFAFLVTFIFLQKTSGLSVCQIDIYFLFLQFSTYLAQFLWYMKLLIESVLQLQNPGQTFSKIFYRVGPAHNILWKRTLFFLNFSYPRIVLIRIFITRTFPIKIVTFQISRMDLSSMPDDVLIRLLNTASPNDVARAKRLNKRFHQIVDTFNLGKPRVKEFWWVRKHHFLNFFNDSIQFFSVESRVSPISPSKIGRLRLGSTSNAPKRRVVVTMRRDRGVKRSERIEDPSRSTSSESANSFVQENLRKVELQEKLSFDGVTLDEEFYKMLTAKKEALRLVFFLKL